VLERALILLEKEVFPAGDGCVPCVLLEVQDTQPKKNPARGPGFFGLGAWCYAATTGILPILACHSFGPVVCTEVPAESTATVTGMFSTSNS